MEKRNLFVWQRTTFLVVAAIASGVAVALSLPLNRLIRQAIPQGIRHQIAENNGDVASSQALILEDRGLSKVMARVGKLAEAELLNFPLPARFQGKVMSEVKLSSKEKVIALTFDDGPNPPYTQQILEILKKNNIKATFFEIGRNAQLYPQLSQQIVAEGHVLGNHTWSHSYRHFSPEGAKREIEDTAAQLYKITGVKTSIFRPPGGFLHNGPADYAKKQKYFVALWSADANDWKRPPVPTLVNNILHEAKSGGMALMHDGGGNRSHTVQALPKVIEELKRQGYKFVTVPELLEMEDREINLQLAAKSTAAAIAPDFKLGKGTVGDRQKPSNEQLKK